MNGIGTVSYTHLDVYKRQGLGGKLKTDFLSGIWNDNEIEWQTFFNFDQRIFLNEINIACLLYTSRCV